MDLRNYSLISLSLLSGTVIEKIFKIVFKTYKEQDVSCSCKYRSKKGEVSMDFKGEIVLDKRICGEMISSAVRGERGSCLDFSKVCGVYRFRNSNALT